MNKIAIIEKAQTIKIDKEPVVIVPLKLWRKLEEHLEDQEALSSPRYLARIKKARQNIERGRLIYPF